MQPLATLGTTMTTYASQNLGAGKVDRIKAGLRCANTISTIWSILSFIAACWLAPP